jgi:hypothetical protein
MLTAHVRIGNDDITLPASSEHQAPLLQSHPEYFLTPAKEHQFRHGAPLKLKGTYSRPERPLPTGMPGRNVKRPERIPRLQGENSHVEAVQEQ